MLTLYLIRHAKSSWDNPALRDFQRPLNERGLMDAPRMARYLAERGAKPDLMVTSPARRANTTAQFFAVQFGIDESDIVENENIYEASMQVLHRIISDLPDTAKTVLMFGHNPTFTDVANVFTDDLILNVPTCGIVRIESEADSWRSLYDGNTRVTACFFPKEVL
jgi:phosphohistidine phosphatase